MTFKIQVYFDHEA